MLSSNEENMSYKMSKKKKLSNEEQLSSVIGDINAFTNKDRGKKSRRSSQSLVKAKGITRPLLCLCAYIMF